MDSASNGITDQVDIVSSCTLKPIRQEANVGETCTICCNVPEKYDGSSATWYKNGEKMNSSSKSCGVKFSRNVTGFVLHFSNLSMNDAAIYTCVVEDEFGKTRCSAQLVVLGNNNMNLLPPVFVKGLPKYSNVAEGQLFEYRVKLQGAEPMEIKWYRGNSLLPNCDDFEYVNYGNGKYGLKMKDLFTNDSKNYKCEAFNLHGDAQSIGYLDVVEVQLTNTTTSSASFINEKCELNGNNEDGIDAFEKFHQKKKYGESVTNNHSPPENTVNEIAENIPATLITGPQDLTVFLKEPVSLTARYFGNPEPTIIWTKGGQPIAENNRIKITSGNGEANLTISRVNADDCGKYIIKIINEHGEDFKSSSLSVEGPAEPPNGIPNVVARDKDVIITWDSPVYDGGCKVTGYCVEGKANSDFHWKTMINNCDSLYCTMKNLTPGESYTFRIKAENIHGLSRPSAESIPILIDDSGLSSPNNGIPIVHIRPAKEFEDTYNVQEIVGRGHYGIVHKIHCKNDNEVYAGKFVKCIKKADKQKMREELSVMSYLRHPKLLHFFEAYESPESPNTIIAVTEYIPGGELFENVAADDFTLTERDCILYMRQICEGVNYMHRKHTVHLDLKPENIMCVSKSTHDIKIVDFGLAQIITAVSPTKALAGTPEFLSPEIVNYEPIGTASDMWSVGVICYVLISGFSPFMGDNNNDTFAKITRGEYDYDAEEFDNISNDAKEFISSLLVIRKEDRLTASQCLRHKWLAQQDSAMRNVKLCTDNLKKFILRRKWQKTAHVIVAVSTMQMLANTNRNGSSRTSSDCSTSSPRRMSLTGAVTSSITTTPHETAIKDAKQPICENTTSLITATPPTECEIYSALDSNALISTTSTAVEPVSPKRKSVIFKDELDIENNYDLNAAAVCRVQRKESSPERCQTDKKSPSSILTTSKKSSRVESEIVEIGNTNGEISHKQNGINGVQKKLITHDNTVEENYTCPVIKNNVPEQTGANGASITDDSAAKSTIVSTDKHTYSFSKKSFFDQNVTEEDGKLNGTKNSIFSNEVERNNTCPASRRTSIKHTDSNDTKENEPFFSTVLIKKKDVCPIKPSNKKSSTISINLSGNNGLSKLNTTNSDSNTAVQSKNTFKNTVESTTKTVQKSTPTTISQSTGGLSTKISMFDGSRTNKSTAAKIKNTTPSSPTMSTKTSETKMKFEQMNTNITSPTTMRKDRLLSNNSNFQKVKQFWNR